MPPPRQDWQVSRAWPSQPSRLASFQAAAAIIAGPCARNSSSTISDGVYCMRRAASVKIRRANGDNLTSTGTAFTTASSIVNARSSGASDRATARAWTPGARRARMYAAHAVRHELHRHPPLYADLVPHSRIVGDSITQLQQQCKHDRYRTRGINF